MSCFPSGAVSRHYHVRMNRHQFSNCLWDNWFEKPSCKMHSPYKRVDLFDSCQSLSVANNIDHSRMAAARNNNEPLAIHVAYDTLVVPYPRVLHPSAIPLRVL